MKLSEEQFKILESKTVYKSQKLQVDRAKISLPNGNIDTWDTNVMPDCYYGVPVEDSCVLLTREWRLGPNKILTQFTACRCNSDKQEENLNELRRELREELGLENGTYKKFISFQWGFRTAGKVTYFLVTDYKVGETNRDENEIQEIISLPIKGLFNELVKNHVVTSDTLLAAKLIEEKFCQ